MAGYSRFFLGKTLDGPGEYVLARDESHHAVNVLRQREGDRIEVFDGLGKYAQAMVSRISPDVLEVRVDEIESAPRLSPMLVIAVCIPKGKRWQMLVEKCTELGADRIVPMLTGRSVAKVEGNADKWRRWIIEAAKQARRAWLPAITEPMEFSQVLELTENDGTVLLLADIGGENPGNLRDVIANARQAAVLIGPEGGFTPGEAAECLRRGGKAISLSPFTLRVETAAGIACGLIQNLLAGHTERRYTEVEF